MTTEIEVVPPPPTAVSVPPPEPPPEDPLRPVAPGERVDLIDIVRGLALFGILAANIRGFSGPAQTYFTPDRFWPGFNDRLAQGFVETFIQGKFITIFAFLFGVGFAVQLERGAGRARFARTYARRLTILMLFGLVHGLLIWFGDILLMYALAGFLLLGFRKASDKTLLICAAIGWSLPLMLVTLAFLVALSGFPMPMPKLEAAELARLRELFTNGSWGAIQMQRMKDALTLNWGLFIVIVPNVLGIFLVGLYAWRKRFFHPTAETLPKYRKGAFYGFAIGVPASVAANTLKWVGEMGMMPTTFPEYLAALLNTFATPLLSLAYVCTIILVAQSASARARLRPFGAIGRTALSNYLLQSIIGTFIFYGYGLGYFGTGPAWLLPLTLVIYLAQAAISTAWLQKFRYGPAEWLWRRLTYPGPLPMRKELPPPEPQPALQ